MSEVWYQKLGFYNNPFSIKPAAFYDETIGYNLDDLFKLINNGELVFIEGEYGSGKTTILKHVIKRFGGKGKVVYYSYNVTERGMDMKGLLSGGQGFFSRVLKKMPNDMILLLDETLKMNKRDCANILGYKKAGNFKSVVFVGPDFKEAGLSDELAARVRQNRIKLRKLKASDAVLLVRRRIGNLPLISDSMIRMIYRFVGRNPRRLLEACEDVCRFAVERGDSKVRKAHITAVVHAWEEPKKRAKRIEKPLVLEAPVPSSAAPAEAEELGAGLRRGAIEHEPRPEEGLMHGRPAVKILEPKVEKGVKREPVKEKAVSQKQFLIDEDILEIREEEPAETGYNVKEVTLEHGQGIKGRSEFKPAGEPAPAEKSEKPEKREKHKAAKKSGTKKGEERKKRFKKVRVNNEYEVYDFEDEFF